MTPDLWICLALAVCTLIAYAQVQHFNFVVFDDPEMVSANPHVRNGITADGILWAMRSIDSANWFPVTRLSHMLDFELFGRNAGMHHLDNVFIHVLSVAALFFFLLRATGARWPSAFVAFVFALHPLHVESVAWIAERKDVLCALFWFLTLWAWVRYTESPGSGRYLLTLLFFVLGIMSKPMIVTLPFVLLLLDGWPLRRAFTRNIVVEKIPFFVLSAGSAVITYVAQNAGGAVQTVGKYPAGLRIENALITVIVYIAKTLWPSGLAVYYPYPAGIPLWQAAAAALALAAVTFWVLREFRSRPYLTTGWLWYLGTLAPVIGLVQVGTQARADRYTYIPMTGLAIMFAWSGVAIADARPALMPWLKAAALAACVGFMAIAVFQLGFWRNSEGLFNHAIEVTGGSTTAWLNLGTAYTQIPGKLPDAIAAFQEGLRINPNDEKLHTNLGAALSMTHVPANSSLAVDHFRNALRIDPAYAEAHWNLAAALLSMGNLPESIAESKAAIRLEPDSAEAHCNLASALNKEGQLPEAVREAETAIRLNPDFAEAYYVLGSTQDRAGNLPAAIESLRSAVTLNPNYAEAHNNLAVAIMKTRGAPDEAVNHLEEAVRIAPDYVQARVNLAMILSRMPGRLPEAIGHLEAAVRLQPNPSLEASLEQMRAQQR